MALQTYEGTNLQRNSYLSKLSPYQVDFGSVTRAMGELEGTYGKQAAQAGNNMMEQFDLQNQFLKQAGRASGDAIKAQTNATREIAQTNANLSDRLDAFEKQKTQSTVSYTHLTLPTICSV